MSKLYVFSDLHITSPGDVMCTNFINCLNSLPFKSSDRLVLLGDIFDLFVGRESFASNYSDLFSLLKSISGKNVEIFYVEGNHDFSLQNLLGNENYSYLKVITTGSFDMDHNGKRIFFTHGDLVNPKDYGYRFLRAFFRSLPLQMFIKLAPISWIEGVGRTASSKSRVYTKPNEQRKEDLKVLYRNYACKKIESGYDYVISGHNHLKDEFEVIVDGRKGKYLNAGFFPMDKCWIGYESSDSSPKFEVMK